MNPFLRIPLGLAGVAATGAIAYLVIPSLITTFSDVANDVMSPDPEYHCDLDRETIPACEDIRGIISDMTGDRVKLVFKGTPAPAP